MMHLLLSRHGNTFAKNQSSIWVGSHQDVPLVESGLNQAKACAVHLMEQEIIPAAIFCGPLQRTRVYALEVIKYLNLKIKPIIDSRLNELNYGSWGGLTQEEIITQFGKKNFDQWNRFSNWPINSDWGGSAALIISEVQSFALDLIRNYTKGEIILVISSQGRLRYFLTLIPGEFEKRVQAQTFKVATGNLCQFMYRDLNFSMTQWNVSPEKIILSHSHFLC